MGSLILLHGPLKLGHHRLDIQLRSVLDLVAAQQEVRGEHSVRDLAAHRVPAVEEANIIIFGPRHLQPSAISKAEMEK